MSDAQDSGDSGDSSASSAGGESLEELLRFLKRDVGVVRGVSVAPEKRFSGSCADKAWAANNARHAFGWS